MAAAFVRTALAEHVVVTQFLSMVRGEQNQGVVVELVLDKCHDEAAYLVVEVGDQGIVARPHLMYELLIHRPCLAVECPAHRAIDSSHQYKIV